MSLPLIYCFFGAPGVGKGTQADRLSRKLNFTHISTGHILRKAIQEKTPVGIKAQSYIQKGRLVPDDVMVALIEEVLLKYIHSKGCILDGFPRTLSQARSLNLILQKHRLQLKQVFFFQSPTEVLVERMMGRRMAVKSGKIYHILFSPPKKEGFCDESGEPLIQREDDKERVVRSRLKVYFSELEPLITYYQKQELVVEIEATGSPQEIQDQVEKHIQNKT